MTMNTAQILMMKYPNADFSKDILLRESNDGLSIEIYGWHLSDPQPNQDQIDAWGIQYDLPFRQQEAANARPYPSVGDQLHTIYYDALNGTTVWKDLMTSIRAQYPKPTV